MNTGRYLLAAFLQPINLAVLVLLAILAGFSDWRWLFWILLAGLEALYLSLAANNSRFRLHVDTRRLAANAPAIESRDDERRVRAMFQILPATAIERFKALRAACLELRKLGEQVRQPSSENPAPSLDELELESMDRLLWVHLRLLVAENALQRFQEKTTLGDLRQDLLQLKQRLATLTAQDPQTVSMRKVVEDNLATSKARLANAEQAQRNLELVRLQIDRLEDQIRTLSEMGINRPAGTSLAEQIDRTVQDLVDAERAIAETKGLTGIEGEGADAPRLIARERVQGRH